VVAIAGPFYGVPVLLVVAIACMQLLAVAASRLSASESLHRSKSEYLRDTFSRYVPSHVADNLAENAEEIRLGGEQRNITVLFCDIRGFTSWSEKVAPEKVISELNMLLTGLTNAVLGADGTLDKYTGDGLMAFWNAPIDQPDQAHRATGAAIEMLRELEKCNAHRMERGLDPFAIGIGIHTGPAVVGNIGHERRLDYTAIGDTVNLSARIEASTKEVGSVVLMSKSTYSELNESQQEACARIGGIKVKGRVEPVDVYTFAQNALDQLTDIWSDVDATNQTITLEAA
jgi:adenylate cyclase